MNDSRVSEGLVPSLLVFGVMPSQPVIYKTLHEERERMGALPQTRAQMATLSAGIRNAQTVKSKVPPAVCVLLNPGDLSTEYQEGKHTW